MAIVCQQCGAEFQPNRPHQVYDSQECRQQGYIERDVLAAQEADKRVSHPLAEVREAQEAAKAEWSTAIYAEIVRILQARGQFFADDLEPMGIPDEHRNLIGSQVGSLASRHYIHEVGRRASRNPARKAAKSSVYELTRKGREKLAEVGAGVRNSPGNAGLPGDDDRGASADLDEPTALFPEDTGRGVPLNPLSDVEAA